MKNLNRSYCFNYRNKMKLFLTLTLINWFGHGVQCWLFTPRITPYYYPFPYPVPANLFPGGSTAGGNVVTGVSPSTTTTLTGTSSIGPYIGQSPIHSLSDYNYNWNNYQNYPNSAVLFPSSSGIGSTGGGSPTAFGSILPIGGGTIQSLFPSSPGSLIRSWWNKKFNKFGMFELNLKNFIE